VRIGPQRQAAFTVFAKPAGRMREVALKGPNERVATRLPIATWIERAMSRRPG
jgi:hypothetical protein